MTLLEFQVLGENDLERQIQKFNEFPQIANAQLQTAMSKSVTQIHADVLREGVPTFMSRLKGSLGSKVTTEGPLSIVGRFGSSIQELYPVVMEEGRKPGRMPPPSSLNRWVQIKFGITDSRAIASTSYLVARSIGKKGIEGRHFMKRGYETAKPKIDSWFSQALDNITQELRINGA